MQNRRNELAEIEAALGRNDFQFIRRMAHTWKGICRPYGFVHLETLSKTLEGAGEREDRSEVARLATEIRVYLDNVRIVYDS
jgi:HPt (histidine-containing phosphotransfer) domain-containing protein